MSSLDVIFLYTPLAYENTFVEIGTGILTAKLKQAGFNIAQDDLNVRLINDYWMNPNEINWLRNNLTLSDMQNNELLFFMPTHIADPYLSVERLLSHPEHEIARQVKQEGNIEMYHVLMISYMFKRKVLLPSHSYYIADIKRRLEEGNPFLERFFEETFFNKFGVDLPPVIGMSLCTTEQTYPSLVLGKMIKEVSPSTHIVWGGAWPSNADVVAANLLKEIPYVDSIVRFEFVHIIENFIKAVMSRDDSALAKVPNIVFRKQNGDVVETDIIGPPPFDEVPMPDFEGMPLGMYRDIMLPVKSARNCWWGKCIFCYHKCNPQVVRYQQRPVEQVYNDIKIMAKTTGVNVFHLADHSTHMKTLLKLADRLLMDGPMIKILAMVRPTGKWTRENCRLAAMAGLQKVYLGLESVSQKRLDQLQKGITIDMLEHDLDGFASAGILTRVFVLDYPTQTPQEFRDTLQWILDKHNVIDAFIAQRFQLGRNSIVFRKPHLIDIEIDPNADFDLNIYNHKYKAKKEIPYEEFFEIRSEFLRKFMELKAPS